MVVDTSGVELLEETSDDVYEDRLWSSPPSPCDILFEGGNVVINGRSSLAKTPRTRKLRFLTGRAELRVGEGDPTEQDWSNGNCKHRYGPSVVTRGVVPGHEPLSVETTGPSYDVLSGSCDLDPSTCPVKRVAGQYKRSMSTCPVKRVAGGDYAPCPLLFLSTLCTAKVSHLLNCSAVLLHRRVIKSEMNEMESGGRDDCRHLESFTAPTTRTGAYLYMNMASTHHSDWSISLHEHGQHPPLGLEHIFVRSLYLSSAIAHTAPATLSIAWTTPQFMFYESSVTRVFNTVVPSNFAKCDNPSVFKIRNHTVLSIGRYVLEFALVLPFRALSPSLFLFTRHTPSLFVFTRPSPQFVFTRPSPQLVLVYQTHSPSLFLFTRHTPSLFVFTRPSPQFVRVYQTLSPVCSCLPDPLPSLFVFTRPSPQFVRVYQTLSPVCSCLPDPLPSLFVFTRPSPQFVRVYQTLSPVCSCLPDPLPSLFVFTRPSPQFVRVYQTLSPVCSCLPDPLPSLFVFTRPSPQFVRVYQTLSPVCSCLPDPLPSLFVFTRPSPQFVRVYQTLSPVCSCLPDPLPSLFVFTRPSPQLVLVYPRHSQFVRVYQTLSPVCSCLPDPLPSLFVFTRPSPQFVRVYQTLSPVCVYQTLSPVCSCLPDTLPQFVLVYQALSPVCSCLPNLFMFTMSRPPPKYLVFQKLLRGALLESIRLNGGGDNSMAGLTQLYETKHLETTTQKMFSLY
uniref:Uncharacterized protein n=1 Tax=Timema bartmani TaxID=61472 RepID=A0A7R9ENN3_9NEOP|nr:unnamed protein product [Timema bartmani]